MKKLLAALSFFTRLPFWRLADIPSDKYRQVVDLWPAAGWVTGGFTALAIYMASHVLPMPAAVTLAFICRAFITGGLHEDGFADFFDGFGGGTDRERILMIMKDSHIGTYGVMSLILYYLLSVSLLSSLPAWLCCLIVLAADPWCKFCGSFIINLLPYARKASEAKNKLIYNRMTPLSFVICLVLGILPALLLPPVYLLSLIIPMAMSLLLIALMKRKLNGYTGDCCGATDLLCELGFYISSAIIFNQTVTP